MRLTSACVRVCVYGWGGAVVREEGGGSEKSKGDDAQQQTLCLEIAHHDRTPRNLRSTLRPLLQNFRPAFHSLDNHGIYKAKH